MNKLVDPIKEVSSEHVQRFNTLVSDVVGIINLVLKRNELKEYDLHMYQCLSTNVNKLIGVREISSGGLGVDVDQEKAMLACLGEAVERYCLSFPKNLIEKEESFEQIYSESPFSKKAKYWLCAKGVLSGKEKYFPAAQIYLPFFEKIREQTSTGVAAHSKIESAIEIGVYECIERDALMMYFHGNVPALEIINVPLGLLEKIKKNFVTKILRLTHDSEAIVYLAYIYDDEGHFGIGAGCATSSDVAITKALIECLFTHFYSKNIIDLRKEKKENIVALYEHFLYYQKGNFKKLFRNEKKQNYKEEKTSYSHILKSVPEPYFVDITTDDIGELVVIKTIIPGYIDINKTHSLPPDNCARWEIAKKLGGIVDFSEPHPFP